MECTLSMKTTELLRKEKLKTPQGIIKIFFLLLTILTNAHGEKTMAHTTYSVVVKTVEGFQVYYIQQDGKAVAEIVPALGNNCYAFKVADGDTWLNLIDAPPDLATLEARPTAYGNPILFPFPNRIRNGTWQFEGKTYQFDKAPDSPTTIHGLLLNLPYQVESHVADENESNARMLT